MALYFTGSERWVYPKRFSTKHEKLISFSSILEEIRVGHEIEKRDWPVRNECRKLLVRENSCIHTANK